MITPASSRALRAALASKPASTVYAGVTAVRMASTGVTHREARYPMHTATFKAVDFDGKPAPHAVVLYLNTTDSTKTVGIGFANYLGQFKASVAEGTYQLVTTGFDYRPGARPAGAIATSPEFRIDAGHTDGTVDLRSATTPVRTTVFKPVDHAFLVTSLSRGPSDGSGGIGVTLMNGLDAVVRVTPTRGALHGEQTLPWLLAATGHDATGEYRIGVGNDRSGRIPATPIAWHYGPAQVVTRDNVFYGLQDPTQARFITSVRAGSIGACIAVPLPGRLTEYRSAHLGIPLEGELVQVETDDTIKGWQASVGRMATAGTRITETWDRAPLHSRTVPRVPGQVLPATVSLGSDGTVRIFDMPMSDAEPTHIGNPDRINGQIASRYAVRADDTVVDSGPGFLYFAGGSIPSATRSGAPYAHPTELTTSFSTPASAAIPVPSWYACMTPAPCTTLPILSADYTAAVGLDNAFAKPGRQTLGIRVHQAGRTSPRGITSVAAWLTYDGATWVRVPVTGSGGSYAAHLTVPRATAGRTTAGMKVQITDAAGSRLVETVTGAFGLPR